MSVQKFELTLEALKTTSTECAEWMQLAECETLSDMPERRTIKCTALSAFGGERNVEHSCNGGVPNFDSPQPRRGQLSVSCEMPASLCWIHVNDVNHEIDDAVTQADLLGQDRPQAAHMLG
jgi:hypothetical protein